MIPEGVSRPHRPHAPVTSLTLFGFAPADRPWALAQMGLARPLLREVAGLRFRKLMGSGRGYGFTLRPDWSRYALLAVWSDRTAADIFLESSPFMKHYRSHAAREWTVLLSTRAAHGAWDGANPFLPVEPSPGDDEGPIAVLTRATIRVGRAAAFWGAVAPVREEIEQAPGLRASIGIGEAPVLRQATFSIWENERAMRAFAYDSPAHRGVIDRTRREGWYREELFARFRVLDTIGELP